MNFMDTQPITAPANRIGDPASDVMQYDKARSLDALLAPRSVAVIGASEKPRSMGRTVLRNLTENAFGGTVYPISPNSSQVLGIPAYPRLADAPERVDLAVIVTPAATVPDLISECVQAGVHSAVVVSSGFRETGEMGRALEAQMLERARRGGLRILGPNSLGIMRPPMSLNASGTSHMARKGSVAFLSQSGALGTAVLDWSLRENVGFSAFISLGSMLDVGWGDLIDYLGGDSRTGSIVIYMETIGDARGFLSAAREVALTKPIIVIKAGRSSQGARAAASHTGALTGSDAVLDAAFRRVGVLRVNSIADLFQMAEVLAKQPRPAGPRLAIVTNAGGPGVLATDALVAAGGALAEFSNDTLAELDSFLPPDWSHHNPIDILGDADPARFARTVELVARDSNTDGILAILTPQVMTDPTATAEALKPFAQLRSKPLLASWMGGPDVEIGANILRNANVPVLNYPDTAARLFDYMWRYSENLRALYETPSHTAGVPCDEDCAAVRDRIHQARAAGRTILSEYESKQILAAYAIPVVETRLARKMGEAVRHAEELGYPVVVKLHSETLTHKREVGGVKLDLHDAREVRAAFRAIKRAVSDRAGAKGFQGVTIEPMIGRGEAPSFELILGSTVDPQFGSVLLFGSGGARVELEADRALGLPPLNTTLARRMMEGTRVYRALHAAGVDLAVLEQVMVRFSQLVVEQKWIREIDINPLRVTTTAEARGNGNVLALDARIILYDPAQCEAELPRLAIRPYPSQYTWAYSLKNGEAVVIRPIRPDDEPLMIHFHEKLSEQTVYLRYFHMLNLSQRIAHERLTRICFNDYDREIALVVERTDPLTREREILGVARLSKLSASADAEWAILVRDDYQRQGLGSELLTRLIEIGRAEGFKRLVAEILPDNYGMRTVADRLGFKLNYELDEGVTKAEMQL